MSDPADTPASSAFIGVSGVTTGSRDQLPVEAFMESAPLAAAA